jgi:hypothetical protein
MTEFEPYGSAPKGASSPDLSDVDLPALTRRLRDRLVPSPVEYVPGKTMIRNEVIDELGCSAEAAEALVDELEAQGYIRYTGSLRTLELEPHVWTFVLQPGSGGA